MKVLIDTCVIVDILQKREPFYQVAMEILLAISDGRYNEKEITQGGVIVD